MTDARIANMNGFSSTQLPTQGMAYPQRYCRQFIVGISIKMVLIKSHNKVVSTTLVPRTYGVMLLPNAFTGLTAVLLKHIITVLTRKW
jgi:hypothetical protein